MTGEHTADYAALKQADHGTKFKVRASCDVAPGGKPMHYYQTGDFDRRMKGANSCHGFDVTRRSRLDEDRIVLDCTITFVSGHGPQATIVDAARAALDWLRWTLHIVYGLGTDIHDMSTPMPHLKVTVEPVGSPIRREQTDA
jgi:hypothetical protein